jgi:hypothetical protein
MEVKKPMMKRVPPGDRWTLIEGDGREVYSSITLAIEAIFRLNGQKKFFIDAGEGLIYIVVDEPDSEHQVKFNIYGE